MAAPACYVRLCGGRCLRGELPPRVVDGVVPRQDQLADGQHGVTLVDEVFQDARQRLRRMKGRIVEQHDTAGLHLGGDPLVDGVRIIVLPVQRILVGNDLKSLRRKGLLGWPLCASAKNLTCK